MSASENNGSTMVYHEIHAVVKRYMDEAPDMTVFQVIGALEAVKCDVMDNLKKHNRNPASPESDDKCEGCGDPATCLDPEGIPLCEECAKLP